MLVYTVTIECPDEALRAEVLAWLEGDHLGDVVRAGALRAEATVLDGPTPSLECHYWFASRAAFEAYEQHEAPRLRAEGRASFGPERGVRMSRRVGEVRVTRARS
jgi:hypothetical protein